MFVPKRPLTPLVLMRPVHWPPDRGLMANDGTSALYANDRVTRVKGNYDGFFGTSLLGLTVFLKDDSGHQLKAG